MLLHHPQNGGNDAWVVIPGVNFTEVDMVECVVGETASIVIPWLDQFTLTLSFVAVSNVALLPYNVLLSLLH